MPQSQTPREGASQAILYRIGASSRLYAMTSVRCTLSGSQTAAPAHRYGFAAWRPLHGDEGCNVHAPLTIVPTTSMFVYPAADLMLHTLNGVCSCI